MFANSEQGSATLVNSFAIQQLRCDGERPGTPFMYCGVLKALGPPGRSLSLNARMVLKNLPQLLKMTFSKAFRCVQAWLVEKPAVWADDPCLAAA